MVYSFARKVATFAARSGPAVAASYMLSYDDQRCFAFQKNNHYQEEGVQQRLFSTTTATATTTTSHIGSGKGLRQTSPTSSPPPPASQVGVVADGLLQIVADAASAGWRSAAAGNNNNNNWHPPTRKTRMTADEHEKIGNEELEMDKAQVKTFGVPRVGPDNSLHLAGEWELLSEEEQNVFKSLEYFSFRERLATFQTSGSEQIGAGVLATAIAKALICLGDLHLQERLVCDGNRPRYTHLDNDAKPDIVIFFEPDDECSSSNSSKPRVVSILCVAEAKSTDTGGTYKEAITQLEKSFDAGWPMHLLEDSYIPAYTVVGSFVQIGYLQKEGTVVKFYPCGDPIDISKECNAGKVAHALWRVQLGMKYLYDEK
jgi:hypothetical protein